MRIGDGLLNLLPKKGINIGCAVETLREKKMSGIFFLIRKGEDFFADKRQISRMRAH